MGYLGPISRNNVGSHVNYITSGNATDGITGWNLYNDAGASPVDGTGGTAAITLVRNTSAALRQGADFLLSKSAVSAIGSGVSYDFTIEASDLGQDLAISFDYKLISGTYASGDIRVFIIQNPSGTPVLITPSGNSVETVSVGAARKEVCFFKASSTQTSYRLCIHVASASTSAYSLSLDNFYVGLVSSNFISMDFVGSSQPGLSDSGSARLYFDVSEKKLKISEDGASYSVIGSGASGGGGGSTDVDVEISAFNIDWSAGSTYYKSISAAATFTFSNMVNGKTISVIITNASQSDVSVALPASKVSGVLPTVVAPGKTNIYTYIRSNNTLYVSSVTDLG